MIGEAKNKDLPLGQLGSHEVWCCIGGAQFCCSWKVASKALVKLSLVLEPV